MALNYARASSQYSSASYSRATHGRVRAMGLVFRQASLQNMGLVGVGNSQAFLQFDCLQSIVASTGCRAISFANFAETPGIVISDSAWHIAYGEFDEVNHQIRFWLDGNPVQTTAWGNPDLNAPFDVIQVGRTISNGIEDEYLNGDAAHVALWTSILSETDRNNFLTRAVNPSLISPGTLLSYRSLQSDLTDSVGILTWSEVNFTTQTFVATGLDFPPAGPPTFGVSYTAGEATEGSAPVDGTEYEEGDYLVLPAPGTLHKWNASFAGWERNGTVYQPNDAFPMPAAPVIFNATYQDHVIYSPQELFTMPGRNLRLYAAWAVAAPVPQTLVSTQFATRAWGTDLATIYETPDPSVGILVTNWAKIHPMSGVYPRERGNAYSFVIQGENWGLISLFANGGIPGLGLPAGRYNPNTMLGIGNDGFNGGHWAGDYTLADNAGNVPFGPVTEEMFFGWTFTATQIIVNSDHFVIRMWLKLGQNGTLVKIDDPVMVSDIVTFADARAFAVANGGMTQEEADAWTPSLTGHAIRLGYPQGFDDTDMNLVYFSRTRVYERGTEPTLQELNTIATNLATDMTAWADWSLEWAGESSAMQDQTGKGHNLVPESGAIFLGGPNLFENQPIPLPPVTHIINGLSPDVSTYSDRQILDAAGIDLFMEHASVGGQIVDGLVALGGRYTYSGTSARYGDYAAEWFADNSGVVNYFRGNPSAAEKISGFSSRFTANLAAQVDAATYKFCFIDAPADGTALFNSVIAEYEAISALYPAVRFILWTMPIEVNNPSAERHTYNQLIRQYAIDNEAWLFDIASIQSYVDGNQSIGVGGVENMWETWADPDGGHLNANGMARVAQCLWALRAEIAIHKRATATLYTLTFNGNNSTGGTAPVDTYEYLAETYAIAPAVGTLVRDGYTFVEWNTAADGSGTPYAEGDAVLISGNQTLYAIWAAQAPAFDESFDSGTLSLFTETDPAGVLTFPSAVQTHDGAGSLRINYAGASSAGEVRRTLGTPDLDFFIEFWLFTSPGLSAWSFGPQFFQLYSFAYGPVVRISDQFTDIRCLSIQVGTAPGESCPVSAEAWYKIEAHWVADGTSNITVYDNSGSGTPIYTHDFLYSPNQGVTDILFGALSTEQIAGTVGYIDSVNFSQTVIPSPFDLEEDFADGTLAAGLTLTNPNSALTFGAVTGAPDGITTGMTVDCSILAANSYAPHYIALPTTNNEFALSFYYESINFDNDWAARLMPIRNSLAPTQSSLYINDDDQGVRGLRAGSFNPSHGASTLAGVNQWFKVRIQYIAGSPSTIEMTRLSDNTVVSYNWTPDAWAVGDLNIGAPESDGWLLNSTGTAIIARLRFSNNPADFDLM